jgi:hypothetical protein
MLIAFVIVKKLEIEEAIEPTLHRRIAEATPRRPWKSSGMGEMKIEITANIAAELKRSTSKAQKGSEIFLRIA